MSQKITRENFTAAMRAAVENRGEDWQYPSAEEAPQWRYLAASGGASCRYFLDDGSCACLIGTALAELGYGSGDVTEGQGAFELLVFQLGVDKVIGVAAREAQGVQDDGGTWGEALAVYLATLGNND